MTLTPFSKEDLGLISMNSLPGDSLCFPTDTEECLWLKCCSCNSERSFGVQGKMLAGTTLSWRTVEFIHTQMLFFASSVESARLGNSRVGVKPLHERSTQELANITLQMNILFVLFSESSNVRCMHTLTHTPPLSLAFLYLLLQNFLLSSPASIKQQQYSLH